MTTTQRCVATATPGEPASAPVVARPAADAIAGRS